LKYSKFSRGCLLPTAGKSHKKLSLITAPQYIGKYIEGRLYKNFAMLYA